MCCMGRSAKESAKKFERNVIRAYQRGDKSKKWAKGMIIYNVVI